MIDRVIAAAPTVDSLGRHAMRIDQGPANYLEEARAMRRKYIGELLKSGWIAVAGFLRLTGHTLKQSIDMKLHDADQISEL
jgi:hypothetical protein